MLPSQVNHVNLAENNDVPDLGKRALGKKLRLKKHYTDDNDDGNDEALEHLIKQPKQNSNHSPPNNHNNKNYLSPRISFEYIDQEPDDVTSFFSGKSGQIASSKNIVVVDDVPLCRLKPQAQIAPVFINHENRQFLNPISYIGGPRIGRPLGVSIISPITNNDNNDVVNFIRDPSSSSSNNVGHNKLENRKSIESITSVLSID